ncbi:MAG: O-antigen ligase family protein [Gemmataceae bacterium]|nr:O-antigen ligase family protein [Gemmataceae bacterium]
MHLVLSPLLFSTATLGAFEFPKATLLHLIGILLFALGVCALMRWGSALPRGLWRRPLLFGVLLFVVSAMVSTATSIAPVTSFLGMQDSHAGLTTVLAGAAVFLATRAMCRGYRDAELLLRGVVVAAAIAATYALLQFLGLDPIPWQEVSNLGPFARPFGTMGHANFLAAYLVAALPLVLHFACRALAERRWPALAVLALVAVLCGLTIVLSVSRGAWIGLGCALAVLLAGTLAARRWRAAIVATGIAAGMLGLLAAVVLWSDQPAVAAVRHRLERMSDTASREHLWAAGMGMFLDRPLLGQGLDTFQLVFGSKRASSYWELEWGTTPARAHNEVVQVLATQGLLGGAALLLILVGMLVSGFRAWRRAPGESRGLVLSLAAGATGFVVQSGFNPTMTACGVLFATMAALLSRFGEDTAWEAAGTRRWFAVALGCALPLPVTIFGINFASQATEASTSLAAGAILLVALVAVGWAMLGGLESAPLVASGVVAPSVGFDLRWPLAQGAVWLGAAVAIAVGVVRPLEANLACRAGECLMQTNPRGAFETLVHATQLDPTRDVYWARLSAAAQAAARASRSATARRELYRIARSGLERALSLAPAAAWHHDSLGQLLARMARERLVDVRHAYAAFDRALSLDPANVQFHVDAANAALGAQDRERAFAYASRACELDPHYAPARAQLGYLLLAEGKPFEAARLLFDSLEDAWRDRHHERSLALANLATAYLNLRLYDAAVVAGQQALGEAPQLVELRCHVAQALEMLGRREEAAAAYRQVLERVPRHPIALAALERLR